MKQNTKQGQMVIHLGREIGIPFRVWHAEKQEWIKNESTAPILYRYVPRPTYHTVLVHVPNKGTRSEHIPIPPESPVVRSAEYLQNLLSRHHLKISASPEVSDDFPWIASAYWNDFVGGSTELWLPEQQQWVRADALEYPRCLPHSGKFLATERELGYGGEARQANGSLHFDWFPVLYEQVTERPCTISIQAAYSGKRHSFTVRGHIRPAESTTSSSTH